MAPETQQSQTQPTVGVDAGEKNPQGAQPPVSYRLPFRSRETDGCGLIQAVPETNHNPCYRRNPLSPVKRAAVSDSNECSATYCRRALKNSRIL